MHLHHNCHQDCGGHENNCPWVYVGREEKYLCLRCNQERYISSGNWSGIIWIVLLALLIALAADNRQPPQTPNAPTNQPTRRG